MKHLEFVDNLKEYKVYGLECYLIDYAQDEKTDKFLVATQLKLIEYYIDEDEMDDYLEMSKEEIFDALNCGDIYAEPNEIEEVFIADNGSMFSEDYMFSCEENYEFHKISPSSLLDRFYASLDEAQTSFKDYISEFSKLKKQKNHY